MDISVPAVRSIKAVDSQTDQTGGSMSVGRRNATNLFLRTLRNCPSKLTKWTTFARSLFAVTVFCVYRRQCGGAIAFVSFVHSMYVHRFWQRVTKSQARFYCANKLRCKLLLLCFVVYRTTYWWNVAPLFSGNRRNWERPASAVDMLTCSPFLSNVVN